MTGRTYASAPSLAMMRQALAASFCDEPSNYVINDDGTILHNGAHMIGWRVKRKGRRYALKYIVDTLPVTA